MASASSWAGRRKRPSSCPTYLLARGIYTWYVWPAFKHANAATTFGNLIGRATFVYAK